MLRFEISCWASDAGTGIQSRKRAASLGGSFTRTVYLNSNARDEPEAVPGVQRHQTGDREFRLLLAVEKGHENPSLGAVARLLRVRTRHALSEHQKLVLLHGRRPFAQQGSR